MSLKQLGRDFKDDPTIQGSLSIPFTMFSIGWIVGDFMQDKGSPTHILLGIVIVIAAATIYRLNDRFSQERQRRIETQRLLVRVQTFTAVDNMEDDK